MKTTHPQTVTLGEIRSARAGLLAMSDDTLVTFGAGNLTWAGLKERGPREGPAVVQMRFNEIYQVTFSPDD